MFERFRRKRPAPPATPPATPPVEAVAADANARSEPRDPMCIPVVVDTGGETYDAVVLDLSQRGARLYVEGDVTRLRPCIGQLMAVRPSGWAPFATQIRWYDGRHLGVQFLVNVNAETLATAGAGRRLRARPSRARVQIAAELVAGPSRMKAQLLDISGGGARIGCARPPEVGAPVMLHLDGLMPIAGYVRWVGKAEVGMMFTRLLPINSARYIADEAMVSPLWLQEVIEQHHTSKGDDIARGDE